MNLHTIDITIIAAYLVICLLIGFMKFGKIRNIRDYTLGRKPFSTSVLIATTFATFVGSKQLIGNVTKVYELGIIFIIPILLTPIPWFFLAKIITPNLKKFHEMKLMSLSDIMCHWYGDVGRWVTNIMSIFLVMAVSAIGAIATGYLLHYFMNIPEAVGMLIGLFVVTLYSTFGGISSVAFTDVFQFLIFFIALPVACIVGYHSSSGIEDIVRTLPSSHLSINHGNMVLFLSLLFYSLIPNTDIAFIQRALIAKDEKQFFTSFSSVSLLILPLLIIVSLIGLMIYKFNPNLNSNIALYYFIDNYLGVGIKGFMIAGILAVIMSTQDSYLNTVSSIISHDFCKKIWSSLTERQEVLLARVSCVLISLVSVVIVFSKLNIMDIIWLSQNFWMPLVTFPLVAGLLGARISKMSFNVLIVASLSATAIVRVITGVFDTRSLVAGVIASIFVLYIGNKKYKKKNPKLDQKKTPRDSLIIKLRNSLFENKFSTQSLYIVTIILCAGFIVGCVFLGFQQPNIFNVSFVCIATISLLLLLSDMWSFTNKVILCIWQFTFFLSLILLPSYILLISDFNIIWLINFILSLALFSTFTNKVKALFLGVICLSFFYVFKKHTSISIDKAVVDINTLSLLYAVFIVTSLVITIYQSRYVSKEIVKQLEKKVEERTSELKKALYAKQEFLNKLGHEVRTPIHNIIAVASGLSEGWNDYSEKERKGYVDMVSESADRLMKYTTNILDLSSIKQNKFLLKKQDNVNIAIIAADVVRNAESLVLTQNKNLRIILEIKGVMPLVSCDPIKFGQIISNLLDNAIRYSNKGDILLELKKEGDDILLKVSDSGVGIPDNEKEKIFESFYESSRTKTNAGGKGLGLSIVKEFVQLHNGSIKVQDKAPSGSIFVVRIPRM